MVRHGTFLMKSLTWLTYQMHYSICGKSQLLTSEFF